MLDERKQDPAAFLEVSDTSEPAYTFVLLCEVHIWETRVIPHLKDRRLDSLQQLFSIYVDVVPPVPFLFQYRLSIIVWMHGVSICTFPESS
ncbi:unnamed protein product [Urochloa humidicola]